MITSNPLVTLAYRYTPEIAGTICVYQLPTRFRDVYDTVAGEVRDRPGTTTGLRRLPYTALVNALCVATGDVVRLIPNNSGLNGDGAVLLSREPINPWVLHTALAAWESALLSRASERLADLFAGVDPIKRPVGDGLSVHAGQADPESWVYDVAGWEVARRFAQTPMPTGDRTVRFTPDTSANLLTWQDPVASRRRDGTVSGRALHVVTARLATFPDITDPVLLVSANIGRLADFWGNAKHAWVDPGHGAALLLLPVLKQRGDGEWRTLWAGHAADVTEALGVNALPEPTDDSIRADGPIRAREAVRGRTPIGNGVGPRFFNFLSKYADQLLAPAEPIQMQPVKVSIGRGRASRTDMPTVTKALRAQAREPISIVCLYDNEITRARMRDALASVLTSDTLHQPDGKPASATPNGEITVTFHRAQSSTLAPGAPSARSPLLDILAAVATPQPATLAILCPTDPSPFRPGADKSVRQPPDQDPKPQLRRLFAARGAVSQFLAPQPNPQDPAAVDHAAISASRDLLRSCGIADDRFGAITAAHPALPASCLVGVHVRTQSTTPGRPQYVLTLAALVGGGEVGSAWEFLAFHPNIGWSTYPRALAAFHAGPIHQPAASRSQAHDVIRSHVRVALDQLRDRFPIPTVVYVASAPGRTIWQGLQNKSLREGPIPGPTSGAAVVRVGMDMNELPRPVRVDRERTRKGDAPSMTQGLFQMDESARAWYLINRSRLALSGAAGREGEIRTRWEASEATRSKYRIGDDWHSMTVREFVVVERGEYDEETLIAASARLCEQSAQWDGRTRAPAPLHLARLADKGHPDHHSDTEVV